MDFLAPFVGAGQLALLLGIFLRLGRIGERLDRHDERLNAHHRRLTSLEHAS